MEKSTLVSLSVLASLAALLLTTRSDAQDTLSEIADESNVERSIDQGGTATQSTVFPCDYPPKPYDPYVESVPSGSSYCSPDGGHDTYGDVSDAAREAARKAAARAIADGHAKYSCEICEEEQRCAKEVLVHPDDEEWEYETATYFDVHIDENGNSYSLLHAVVVKACLKSGGFFLRTCKACL